MFNFVTSLSLLSFTYCDYICDFLRVNSVNSDFLILVLYDFIVQNILSSLFAKLFFKTFISLKHLSDYRTVGLSHRRTIGLSDYRIIATAPFTVRLKTALAAWSSCIESSVILLQVILFFILSKCCKWLSLMKTTNLPTVTVSEKNH
jgi:hypothetical protein